MIDDDWYGVYMCLKIPCSGGLQVIPVKAKRTKKVGFSLALPLADVGKKEHILQWDGMMMMMV